MIPKHNSILLFSGGLDSFIAWHYLKYPPALFFNAGQSYIKKEIEAVKFFSRKYRKMKLYIDNSLDLSRWEEGNFYIPYRNIFFVMIASLYAPKVYLVGIKGDRVDDNNPNASRLMSKFLLNFNDNKSVEVTSPFYKMSKSNLVKWYIDNKLPIEDLLKTISCYSKKTINQCGQCNCCFRRWVALENNGIKEEYDSPPWEWEGAKEYIKKMKAGLYDKERTEETFLALKKYIKI
ncbi:MAG: 7-cyano-7-deazaguanine synthase [bacterium]|nr:7-cyano-7-deazaguanine synthase [bacterium]